MTEVKRPNFLIFDPKVSSRTVDQESRNLAAIGTTTPTRAKPPNAKRAAIGQRALKLSRSSGSLVPSIDGDSSQGPPTSSSSSSSSLSRSSLSSSSSPNSPMTATLSPLEVDQRQELLESPSLILPYLYVGDQDQTHVDTISSLNISYVLSLQSLPKFLDSDLQLEHHHSSEDDVSKELTSENELSLPVGTKEQTTTTKEPATGTATTTTTKTTPFLLNTSCSTETGSIVAGPISNKTVTKDLLPSINSSKDYLVKFRSCVNRLIKGKCINISDTFEQLVDKFFDETHNFIEEARRNRCNILVHCKAGISRSPTIAIAFLMKWKRLQLKEAYDFVKRCRPQISPNLNFMGQLMNYERKLLQGGLHSTTLPSPTTCCLLGFPNHEQSDKSWGEQITNTDSGASPSVDTG